MVVKTPCLLWSSTLNIQTPKVYFKQVKWNHSGDLSVVSSDRDLTLLSWSQILQHELDVNTLVKIHHPEPIYQTAWLPEMSSYLCVASKSQPIHFYKTFKTNDDKMMTPQRFLSIQVVDMFKEFCQPFSFGLTRYFLVAGSRKRLHVFDLQRPHTQLMMYSLTSGQNVGLGGIISAVAPQQTDHGSIYAAGGVSGITITVDIREPRGVTNVFCTPLIRHTAASVTQVCWTKQEPRKLLVGLGQHNFIYLWDNRYTKTPCLTLPRVCSTCQRCSFDTFLTHHSPNEFLMSGTSRGECLLYSLQNGQRLHSWQLHSVTLTGLSLFPRPDSLFLATCSAKRFFPAFEPFFPSSHDASETSRHCIKLSHCPWTSFSPNIAT